MHTTDPFADPTRARRHTLTIVLLALALTLIAPPLAAEQPPAQPAPTAQIAARAVDPAQTARAQAERERVARVSREVEARVHARQGHARADDATRPATPSLSGLILRTLLSLVLVCGGAYAVLRWGLGRVVTGRADDRLRVLSRQLIEPKRSLLVVQVASRVLVLSSSEAGLHTLAELSGEDAAQFTGSADEGLIGS